MRVSAAQKRIRKAALELFAEKGTASVTVSELAAVSGVVRGTIYKNVPSPEKLFESIAAQLAEEMDQQIVASYRGVDDPALRLAIGMRLYIRRAHEEPNWGRFLVQFANTNKSLREIWSGPPIRDLTFGIESGRYDIGVEQIPGALSVIAGSTLAAIVLVLDGLRTWRDAGTDVAAMVLRALGIEKDEALVLATRLLPDLADLG
ncbi:TetR/AcrR family transcriptional regulator [Oleomonas cavernae]|uniref:TetR/AcrR family transcriptional regulator n=1 Tax=Oleomonas cavernae TaxID=2320859 RepID=A0A418WGY0_9PROT|nr:TetR/AcrR family transcriptional regulator [Oleomonas cavernae]RJF89294.1 TetR/AcrR family transcriptional regulator [Oleomonas cavernae]